jgi:glycosyltransferase involved in cell wall biosynthesis
MLNFTVVLPFYGEIKSLKDSLISISNQKFSEFELILIDDNKTRKWTKNDLCNLLNKLNIINYKIFINEFNMGANYSRNLGIINSDSNYISFIDCGDIWSPNKLYLENKALIEQPDIIYSKQKYNHKFFSLNHNKDHYPNYFKQQMISSICTSSSLTVKRKLLIKVNMFNENLKSSQDADILLRLLKLTNKVKFISSVLSEKNVDHKNSISSNVNYHDNTFIHVRLPYLNLFDKKIRSAVFFSHYSSRLFRNFRNVSIKKEICYLFRFKPLKLIDYFIFAVKFLYYYLSNLIRTI